MFFSRLMTGTKRMAIYSRQTSDMIRDFTLFLYPIKDSGRNLKVTGEENLINKNARLNRRNNSYLMQLMRNIQTKMGSDLLWFLQCSSLRRLKVMSFLKLITKTQSCESGDEVGLPKRKTHLDEVGKSIDSAARLKPIDLTAGISLHTPNTPRHPSNPSRLVRLFLFGRGPQNIPTPQNW